MMNSTNDKSRDIQDFLKKIKEGGDEDKFKDILNKMSTTERVDNFLSNQGDQQLAGLPFPYNPAGLPDDVYQATQRQYGNKIFGPYTTEDKIKVQNFYKGV